MTILHKLHTDGSQATFNQIDQTYMTQGYAVVSFLYFTNLMRGRLLEETPEAWQRDYLTALESADFLLADGIALQVFYRRGVGRSEQITPPNLNGTDFNPKLFDYVIANYTKIHFGLVMFWDEKIGKGPHYLQIAHESFRDRFGHDVDWSRQMPYADKARLNDTFDRDGYEASLTDDDEVRVFFVCLGTPTQEIWIQNNMHHIKRLRLLVVNAGGTIDYLTGLEQRAPDWVVRAKVLETFWRISTHPKKNLNKFLAMFGIVRYRVRLVRKSVTKYLSGA